MKIHTYLEQIRPLSIHARFSIGLRIFERYVRCRGLEDDSLWEYFADMWQFPLIETPQDKMEWGERRGGFADYGLGDEIPDELEEELYMLAISEDYFELWATNTTELAWTNILQGPEDEETMGLIKKLLELSVISTVTVPDVSFFKTHLFSENEGWGKVLSAEEVERWQAVACDIKLEAPDLDQRDHLPEGLQDYS